MIFQGLSVARSCLRPATAPLTILAIKRGLFCNFAKKFKGRHFMGQSSTGLKFQLLLNSKSSKISLRSFKKILDLRKRGYFQSGIILASQGLTS